MRYVPQVKLQKSQVYGVNKVKEGEMTTENYNLSKMWEDMGGADRRRYRGSAVYKVLQSWYFGYLGEVSTVNKLVQLGAIKKVQRVKVEEPSFW